MATKPIEVTEPKFYTRADVEKILGVGKNKAWEIMKRINDEQIKNHKIVLRGKVSVEAFNRSF